MADNISAKDGAGSTFTVRSKDVGAGVQSPVHILGDTTGTPYGSSNQFPVNIDGNSSGIGSLTETAPGTDTASSGINGRLQRVAQRITSLIALVPTALSGSGNFKVAVQESLPAGTNLLGSVKQRLFIASATLTRPANATLYSIGDLVANSATAGSVTALSFTSSDVNDNPIALERMRIVSTDTGVANAQFQAWFFQSDPTANTGVTNGDNGVFTIKQGTFIGTMTGSFLRNFSDGNAAVLTPDEGSMIITLPTSGAKTVFCLIKSLTSWTPGASSTVFTCALEGFQGGV